MIGKQKSVFIEKAVFNYGPAVHDDFETFIDELNTYASQNTWAEDPLEFYRLQRLAQDNIGRPLNALTPRDTYLNQQRPYHNQGPSFNRHRQDGMYQLERARF